MDSDRRADGVDVPAGGCVACESPPVDSLTVGYVGRELADAVSDAFDASSLSVSFDVVAAEDGESGLGLFEDGDVDCLLSRYALPDMTGIELLKRVRAEACDFPVVLLAVEGSEQIASRATAAGVTDYIPVDDSSLTTLPERLTDAVRRERDCIATDQLDGVEAAVEYAADAVIITDTDGTIEYVNPAFEEMTGYSREAAVGRNPRILKSGARNESYYEELWGTILDGRVWEEEITNERKSGEQYIAHQTIAPVTDDDGIVRKFVGIQRDVTTQRRLETQIDRSAQTLSTVYDVTSDTSLSLGEKMDAVLDIGCRYLDLPVAYVTRIEDETQHIVAASGDHNLIEDGAQDPLERTYCRKTIAQEEPLVIDDAAETDWREDPAFERFGLRCYLGARVQVDGSTYGTLCFGGEQPRDELVLSTLQSTVKTLANWLGYEIARHRAEWKLERKNERLDEFASIVSHDLRNPLNVAMLRLGHARESDQPREHLDGIANAHERISTIIEDTLTLARDGHLVEEQESVSLDNLATICWETVETPQATLEIRDDPQIEADPDRVRHIFENLFRNAVEHGREDVTVTVGQTDAGFFVADDGPGIPDSTDVFESGYSTSETGSGFGLAIVERIAEAHGWSVTVTESETGGARFEFDTADDGDRSLEPVGHRR
ncbi:receiver/sensor box histidine kinase [Halovenus salina]|uniref:histidine kinase n=1 Tax=Halovenus salina TaxID=1510225 RepID=A0ABD5VW69_9EURY|nr:PAS domain-containing protein [Halovenus salina]